MTIDAEKPKARRHRDKVEAFHSPLPVRQFGRTQPSQLAVPVVKWLKLRLERSLKRIHHAIHRRMLPVLELDPML